MSEVKTSHPDPRCAANYRRSYDEGAFARKSFAALVESVHGITWTEVDKTTFVHEPLNKADRTFKPPQLPMANPESKTIEQWQRAILDALYEGAGLTNASVKEKIAFHNSIEGASASSISIPDPTGEKLLCITELIYLQQRGHAEMHLC